MDVEELASFALQRVNAYEGLAIDVATWNDAHSYHRVAQRLHARALHGWGIIAGLQVVPADPPGHAVIVQPGAAIDRDGNVIRVPQPAQVRIQNTDADTVCLALRFREALTGPDGGASTRVNEAFGFIECAPPVPSTDIEVARIRLTKGDSAVTAAKDSWNPTSGEIDGRFRRELRPAVADTLTIGQFVTVDAAAGNQHRHGLANVVRDLRVTAPFAVQYIGEVRADEATGLCDLLYISCAGELKLTPREGAHLLGYLRGGGVVFAEPCATQEAKKQENGRFAAAFQRLMTDLKQNLAEVKQGHPLFEARHIFGAPPEGAGGHAPLLANANVILNPNDYGCCWQGGADGKPLPREQIRSAMEFAANVAWHTASRTTTVTSGTRNGHTPAGAAALAQAGSQ